ncbi:cytochrome c biogenesis protein CcsA [Sulfurovum sp. ST-21]|uniref:Cytochrome c biogenesis protein CcsA n=1 Tax=Sulfurovum indicum TaxID=2779528 RepID=A0A7M1S8R2_9BACT|nr:cytochrome c biogenesis protein CcsA [Sulfurovum indicum]QOR62720.1 cytochrome c biogenesis protein CcsA [Sulfurovum indicum]
MLKKILSMKMAVLMLFLFGVIAGVATFIENDYGTQTARALIYKAKWFEVFLAYFIAILTYQMIKYKSYKTKFPVFLFHFSFILIAMGALITRYAGYEGIMHIREGQTSNKMVSDVKMLEVFAKTKEENASLEKELYFSTMTENHLSERLKVGDKEVRITLEQYLPTADEEVVADPNGGTLLEMKVSAGGRGEIHYFKKGSIKDFGAFYISYGVENIPTDKPTFKVTGEADDLKVHFPFILKTLNMETKSSDELKPGDNTLTRRMLYRFGNNAVVLKAVHRKAALKTVSHSLKTKSGQPEYIKLRVSVGDKSKEVVFKSYKGQAGDLKQFSLDGVDIQMRIGAKLIELPFSIKLVDFELERYPGSMTPASYSSRVVLIDKEQNLEMPYHIYMNHVLDHRNYRFFQSSYDPDEKGTVLSVNHDPGTLPTYIAYFLLGLGMLWSLFIPNGRFQMLLKGARKLQHGAVAVLFTVMLALSPQVSHAAAPQVDPQMLKAMQAYDAEHAKHFATLAVQDHQGRMKPMDTVAHEVIAKITGKSSFFGIEPTQMFLGMIMQPEIYQNVPMIKIGHKKIALDLGLPEDTKYARFTDFFSKTDNSYKLYDAVTKASRKKPLEKSQYDKELIKADERLNVSYMAYQGTLMRIYPKPNDENNKWVAPMDALKTFPPEQIKEVQLTISAYFASVAQGLKTGKWENADLSLKAIKVYQKKYGSEVMPSARHIKMEIWYNKLGLFGKLVPLYLLLGVILLVFAFVHVLKPNFSMKWIMRFAWATLIIGFTLHVAGLGIRWYIAGHAPWSNAYESIVFIAASTVLAGIILARRSPFALAGTAILAGVTMGVAHMSFINPEITNLVPVLKSYWLMIHVATIISGDGFLGLGSILSLMVLILFIIRGKSRTGNIDRSIKELTNLSEMALIIGLMLLTVGNFLGGVWANESWGRYWGWDSKETWAAVTILIYAAVIHMRFIPKLNNVFIYNVAATWAYSTVLMTYFGVNYYLSGLHSYAAGDPVPIPMWVYYAIAGLFVLTLLAARNRHLKQRA